jgi:peptide methionine sulfoxide reductase MsrB
MNHCPDCGSKMYNGACTWCHEELYIAEQYYETNTPIPSDFQERILEVEIDRENYMKRDDVKRELKR